MAIQRILLLGSWIAVAIAVPLAGREPLDGAARPPGPEERSVAADTLLAAGTAAPDFSLPDAQGKAVRLNDLRGHPVVLYFYPKDGTTGCTAQACAYRDDHASFDSLGVVVIGISTDSPASHRRFAAQQKLPFPLLADTSGTVARLYRVAHRIRRPDGRATTIARRVTYLIDERGTIRQVWPKVEPAADSFQVLSAVRKLLLEPRTED